MKDTNLCKFLYHKYHLNSQLGHQQIVSIEDAEADDVVASLTEKAIMKGMHVKIASPDKDFKQLLCEKVQIVAPLADLKRWSFYTHEDYFRQHDSHPDIELSLRELR